MTANQSLRARTKWYDPRAASGLLVLPVWEQMVWALIKTTWGADIRPTDKALCLMTIPSVHYSRRFRVFGGRLKQHLR